MPNACPNCGHTTARVYVYEERLLLYDLENSEWDQSRLNYDYASTYLSEALCANCETNLLDSIPGEHLTDEPTVKELLRVARIAKQYVQARLPDAVNHQDQELADCLQAAIQAVP